MSVNAWVRWFRVADWLYEHAPCVYRRIPRRFL